MGIITDAFTQIKAEEGFKMVIRGIINGGLTPNHLEVMATGKISLQSLLGPSEITGMQARKNSSEVKWLARMEMLKPGYLLGLLIDAAPKHGVVLVRNPEYAKQIIGDLKTILGI